MGSVMYKNLPYLGGPNVSFIPDLVEGVRIGRLIIDGTTYELYAPQGGGSGGRGVEFVSFTDANPILNPSGNAIETDIDIPSITVINNYYDNKIPLMTSNTLPSGTASASSVHDTRYNEPFVAMNGIWYTSNGSVGWVPNTSDLAPYIMYTWASTVTFSKLYLETCNWNNTEDVTLTATVEGLTSEDVWENCLQTGNNLSVEFSYYNRQYSIFEDLNGNDYKAIRISFDQPMNVQSSYMAVIRCLSVC